MEAVLTIADEVEAYDGVAPLDEATVLTLQNRPDAVETWLIDGGFALLIGSEASIVVRPPARSRGVGTTLLESLLASYMGPVTAWSHGHHPAAFAMAASHGFKVVRELWVMRRPMSLPLPETPATEIEVRSFRPGDERELLRVNGAAFARHPEQGSLTMTGLRERMAQRWFEPDGLIEAWHGDRLLGFHWTKRHSPSQGEVYVVAIDPAAQGHGLGRLLTLAGLRHLADTDQVHLYVEADNLPARRLYESLGFSHAERDTHVQFARRGIPI
ncbi:mycothiol synthase [Nocardioides sp.]|uniref:mycothiol synthase n=1 Tax=Nocardioides sp. TaxID=35761 RepID=UPI0039E3F1DD